MQNPHFFWLSSQLLFMSFCIAPLNYAPAAKADAGVILDDLIHDLDTTIGKIRERRLSMVKEDFHSKPKNDLLHIPPGQPTDVPTGCREIPPVGTVLRVAVPEKRGYPEFIKVERAEKENATVTGFCSEVFAEVMRSMPYGVRYISHDSENYDDLVKLLSNNETFDAVVGDVTITANRSKSVDFTVPYMESAVAFIVPVKDNAWDFMNPMTPGLWLTIGAFFIFNGFVIWVLEHRVNEKFRGAPHQQFGMMLWFSFSTLVFAHREKVISNLTRSVLIVWVFVVFVLISSYQANLTAQQLQPAITDINDLIKNGEYVGYQRGSFVREVLVDMKFNASYLRNYSTLEEFHKALSSGSSKGGVAAIADELPYIRLLLGKYPYKYIIVSQNYTTSGLGFAFRKGSPLVANVSRAIIELKENHDRMKIISRELYGGGGGNLNSDATEIASRRLGVGSFKGLFLIAGLSSSSALAIFLSQFVYENRRILTSPAPMKQKLYALARVFYQAKDDTPSSSNESTIERGTIHHETTGG